MELFKSYSSMLLRILSWPGMLLVGMLLGAAGMYLFLGPAKNELPPPAGQTTKASKKVTALGRIEPEGGVLTLTVPVPDRVLQFMPGIKEDAPVEKGQELVKLASYPLRELEWKLAQQQLEDALARQKAIQAKGKAQLELEDIHIQQASSRHEVKLQEDQIAFLQLKVENVRKDWARLQPLASTVSQQEMEQQKLRLEGAVSELEMARDTLEKLRQGKALELKAAQAQRAAVQATVASALNDIPVQILQRKVELARFGLEEAILHAPVAGRILQIVARPGEMVSPQLPVLRMANTAQMVVIAEVYETDVRQVKVGQQAIITSRALPAEHKLKAEVIQVGAMIGENRVRDVDPTAETHRRIVEVKVRLRPSPEAARLINHQVTVELATDPAGMD